MIKKWNEFITEEHIPKPPVSRNMTKSKPEKISGQNCKGCAGVDYLKDASGNVKCAHCGRAPEDKFNALGSSIKRILK
jgi:hypothetical protein